MKRPYKNKMPQSDPSAYIDPEATLIGDIEIGPESSVWPQACLRGDFGPIRIGCRSNIQDGSVLHMDMGSRIEIGDDVTIGHGAIIHGCRIDSNSLIGMNATVLDGAHVGENCLVGASAFIPSEMEIPAGSLVLGVPAKVVRPLRKDEITMIRDNAADYVAQIATYLGQEASSQE